MMPRVWWRFVHVQAREVQFFHGQDRPTGSGAPTKGLPPTALPRRRRGKDTGWLEGGRRVRRQEVWSWR